MVPSKAAAHRLHCGDHHHRHGTQHHPRVTAARRSVLFVTLLLTIYVLTSGRQQKHRHQRYATSVDTARNVFLNNNDDDGEELLLASAARYPMTVPTKDKEESSKRVIMARASAGDSLLASVQSRPTTSGLRADAGDKESSFSSKRVVSLVVPLYKAGAVDNLGRQLSLLAHAVQRKRAIEGVLPTVEIQIVAHAPRAFCRDFIQLFPRQAAHIVWLDDLDEAAFRATAAKQEAWLRQRYPFDDQVSTETTLSVDAGSYNNNNKSHALSWRQTAFHLRLLLSQQEQSPDGGPWRQAPGAQVSLPFLVSSLGLENAEEAFTDVQDWFRGMNEAACDELKIASPDDDETVVLFRQVHQAPHDFPSQLPSTNGVLILFDEISKPFVESYRAMLAAAGHTVRTEKLESQVQAFCLIAANEAAILETTSSDLGQWARAVAALQRQEKTEKAKSHLRLRRYTRSST